MLRATPHKLFNQLMASNPDEDEVEELYNDLKAMFAGPFDDAIEDAVANRQCVYIELPEQLLS